VLKSSFAMACTRRPSARPSRSGIAAFITRPISFGPCAPLARRARDDRAQLLVGQLGGQVGRDERGLGLLGLRELGAVAGAEGLGGLDAPLALPAQDGELVGVAGLRGLLQLGQHQAQRRDPSPLPRPHGGGHVGLDLVGKRHWHP
jgi:hypothetical protein